MIHTSLFILQKILSRLLTLFPPPFVSFRMQLVPRKSKSQFLLLFLGSPTHLLASLLGNRVIGLHLGRALLALVFLFLKSS